MVEFWKSDLGQVFARNGILAVLLGWALWYNHGLVERLFTLIENNTRVMEKVEKACGGVDAGR